MLTKQPATVAAGGLSAANNLSDVASAESAMRNLGIYLRTNTRAVRDCLYFDGATLAQAVRFEGGAAMTLRTGAFTQPIWLEVPTAARSDAAHHWLFTIGPALTAISETYGVTAAILSDGTLRLQPKEATGSASRNYDIVNFRQIYSGQNILLTLGRDGTGAPFCYVNGAAVAFTLTGTNGTPTFAAAGVDLTEGYVTFGRRDTAGSNGFAGRMTPLGTINSALSASEILTLAQAGRMPSWCEVGTGTAVSEISGDSSTFVSGLGNWSLSSGPGSVVASSGKMSMTNPGGSNTQIRNASWIGKIGWKYRIKFKHRLASGTANVLTLRPSGPFSDWSGAAISVTPTGTETELSVEVVQLASGTSGLNFQLSSLGTGEVYEIDDFTITPLGPVFKPVIQPCRILDDAGANGIVGVLASGVTPITERRDWRMRAVVDMTSTGNKQLFGAAVFETPQNHAINSIDTECAGTPTFSIGDGSTATKYTASVAHSATRLRETLSANYPADSAKTGIYANVTATGGGTEKIVIRGHRTD